MESRELIEAQNALNKEREKMKFLEIEFKDQEKVLLNRLEKNNKELQDYVHLVSHDLKAPLRNIDTLTAWFKEDYKDVISSDGIETLDAIRTNVEKMETLIKGILVYSSVTYERVTMYDIDLNKLIEETLSILQIPENAQVNIDKKLPVIKGDKYRLLQLFQKLDNTGKSSGIGLSIVKKIVEIYGGTVHAESENGKGTKIIFTLKKL